MYNNVAMLSDISQTLSAVVFMTCVDDTVLLVLLKFTVYEKLPLFINY